ncbi:IS1 family transposase [Nostoc sp. WHI]|nr:IS1 family transposase [Nostoc sp. WHI]MBG1271554.1 IS1 family transposase [Nostoc sp. WHI]
MECLLCGHNKVHKHRKTSKGSQRYYCPHCQQSFTDTFDTLYYRRHSNAEEVRLILQSHAEGSSLRGVSRISGRAYRTVASLVRVASQKAQMMHNQEVRQIETEKLSADEMWLVVSYFNWIWENSRLGTTAAQRAGLQRFPLLCNTVFLLALS